MIFNCAILCTAKLEAGPLLLQVILVLFYNGGTCSFKRLS